MIERMVLLSAYNTPGKSDKRSGGLVGMARSFLFAGSQAVVASHWPLDSQATKVLIENYGKYLKSKGRIETLEAAKNMVKIAVAEYSNKRKTKLYYTYLYFWASFVLVGER